jgi:hypothetical protein
MGILKTLEDQLRSRNMRFQHRQQPNRVFVNGVPKNGTNLVRDVLTMFFPWGTIENDTITDANLHLHDARVKQNHSGLYWGHINHGPVTAVFMRQFRHIVVVRDPYDYVLSRAYFLFDERQKSFTQMARVVQEHGLSFDDAVSVAIRGWCFNGEYYPSVRDLYLSNALGWTDLGCMFIRYEEMLTWCNKPDDAEAWNWFQPLFDFCGIEAPEDWRGRVVAGADRRISLTSTENLGVTTHVVRRRELTEGQKKLFAVVAPGLREALGYA